MLLFLLALSLLLFLTGGHWARRTLFFPALSNARLSGETRFLPRRRSLEGDVRLLVEEVILGPTQPAHRPLLPKETRLLSVLARQRVLFISLSHELLQPAGGRLTAQEALAAIGLTVKFNFPRVRRLELLIEGQVPEGWGGGGLRLERRLLK
jgi:hypothetical protein